jgi:hypothetical protein
MLSPPQSIIANRSVNVPNRRGDAAEPRSAMDDGSGSHSQSGGGAQRELAELRASLAAACRAQAEWPDKVAAAVCAALDFAAADPDRALLLLARDGDRDGEARAYRQTVELLSGLLERAVPAEASPAGGSAGSVQGIAMIVSDHLRAGRVDGLGRIGPALVQFALQPYLGYAEAKRCADRSGAGQR